MKKILLLLVIVSLFSCKKDRLDPRINQKQLKEKLIMK